MGVHDWIDVWRNMHPNEFRFTWMRRNPYLAERLDYILISDSLQQLVTQSDIAPSFRSDHSIPWITLAKGSTPRGTGFWKFNSTLFKDKEFVEIIKDTITLEVAQGYSSVRQTWEMIKMAVQGTTIQYATRKNKARDTILRGLEKQALELEAKIMDYSHAEYLKVKGEIEDIITHKTQGALVRCKLNWLQSGEKNTGYFLRLERHKNNSKNIQT